MSLGRLLKAAEAGPDAAQPVVVSFPPLKQQQQQRQQPQQQQVCPTTLLDAPLLSVCREWQAAERTKYNCTHDEYLRSFSPGRHAGVVANYLSFNTDQATPHFRSRARLFEECTGGVVQFAEATDIAEDPIKDIGSASSVGAELYDAYLMIYSFTSEASSLGLLETLNDRIRASNKLLRYEDIFPKVRAMGEYRRDGRTGIDLLMADGDFFVPVVRIDLLERDGLPLPQTWDDVVRLAERYNSTDLNDDGVADDFGFCLYPRTGSGFNDAWIPELMYSTWATFDQTRGIQQGFFFDEETFEPRIGSGFERAMDVWKKLWPNSADGCITSNFVEGRCAIGFAPPGCWKGTFVNSEEGGVAWRNATDGSVLRDADGEALWRPRMRDGSYAEPYRLRPFGSLEVIDRATDAFVECDPATCPKGERIPSSSRLPDGDRAKILVDSPHVGRLINRVPFYWSGGYGTGIRKSASPAAKDLMWDFFVYVNTPITSVDDVVLPSWLDAWRYSQMEEDGLNFRRGGWSKVSFEEHRRVMLWALGNDVNSALTLRLPGVLTYTRDVVLNKFSEYVDGKIAMEDMKAGVVRGWKDATTARGKLSQVQIYRASLGLNPLSEFDLCGLHRPEMDRRDDTVCSRYDARGDADGGARAATVAGVLVPILFVAAAVVCVWVYLERKRRHLDAIWQIRTHELKFADPPDIAGRGTFGLVVKAEYRGTVVAVKRVIPPKEKGTNRKDAADGNGAGLESAEGLPDTKGPRPSAEEGRVAKRPLAGSIGSIGSTESNGGPQESGTWHGIGRPTTEGNQGGMMVHLRKLSTEGKGGVTRPLGRALGRSRRHTIDSSSSGVVGPLARPAMEDGGTWHGPGRPAPQEAGTWHGPGRPAPPVGLGPRPIRRLTIESNASSVGSLRRPRSDSNGGSVGRVGSLRRPSPESGGRHPGRARRKTMDHIFDDDGTILDEERLRMESNGPIRRLTQDSTDLEAGLKAANLQQVALVLSSVETGVTALSSRILGGSAEVTRAGGRFNWKRWFGHDGATGKNYERLKQDFIVEMRILSKLRHPCITTVMGSVIDQKEEPMLVMEFMEHGSLHDLLHNASIAVDGELIGPILQDVARGARFLHAADPTVVHGDLKAANVLVDGRFRAKIADFGLSAKRRYLGVGSVGGTPYWMAPELLRGEASANTAESDVYSFGVLLYELYARRDPYEGEDPATVLREIVDRGVGRRPPVPEVCPPKIAEIMSECVDGSPGKRPTFEEIDLRIQRLDSENVEPGEASFGHRIQKRRAERNEDLIHQVFPRHVAKALLQGRKVEADRVDLATMFFSDIVGFTAISSSITPDQVSDLLDRLYLKFDALSVRHDVFKIETIGDAYVGVCNLVKDQGSDHARRIAMFAIDTLEAAASTPVLHDDPTLGTVRIRVGVHCGPLVARVVGSRNPRYCVFGDTVNTTARMESNSRAMRIQCSDRAAEVLRAQAPELGLESRGMIPIKGKGEMETFFIGSEGT